MELVVHPDDSCHINTGGGYNLGEMHIHYDSRLTEDEQRDIVLTEALKVLFGFVIDSELLNEAATKLNDVLQQWAEIEEERRVRTE